MKISEIVATDAPGVSFEVFPPKRRAAADAEAERAAMAKTKNVVREIAALKPSFMSVTYGAAGGSTGANTCEVASFVQNDCGVTALAHMTCIASSKAKVAD